MVYLRLLAPATQYESARYSTIPSSSLSPPLLTLPFSSFSLHLPPHPFPSIFLLFFLPSPFPSPHFPPLLTPLPLPLPPTPPFSSPFPPPLFRIECLPDELFSMYRTMYTVPIEAVDCVVNRSVSSLQHMPSKVNV